MSRESIVNVTQLLAVERSLLLQRLGQLTAGQLRELDDGLRLVLDL